MAIEEILDLEQLEVNIYRGGVFSPESGFLQRTFGGHVAGQSLVSAVRTVDRSSRCTRCTATSCGPVIPGAHRSTVERLRDGGSFATRRVSAIQHGETIFSMSASFQTDQSGIEHQDAMPAAPPPDDLPRLRSARSSTTRASASSTEWDVRIVPRDQVDAAGKASQQQVWFRHRDPLPDDPVLHICALAYMSDLTLLGSAQVNTPRSATPRWRRSTTRCGSCARSGPTNGCSTTSRRRRLRRSRADPGQDLQPVRRDGRGGRCRKA